MSAVPQTHASTAKAAGPTPHIDTKLIVPFVNSTRKVFSTMVKVDVKVDYPYLKESPAATYDVSGIIGFSGDIIGSVVLSFQTQSAIKLVEAFTGMLFEANSTDFADAIGELANMIAGAAKKDLGMASSITVPTVVIGTGHTIARLTGVPCIVIPCQTSTGNFAVEVNIKPAK
jgi:chemotaxis protein CheX